MKNVDCNSNAFFDILVDLASKNELLLAKKVIRHIGTAACKNKEACKLLLSLILRISQLNWELIYQGINCLGIICSSGDTSDIKRMALEKGLIPLASVTLVSEFSWKVRVCALSCLIECYPIYRETSNHGAVIIDTITHQLSNEKDHRVIDNVSFNLQKNESRNNFSGKIRTLMYIFKHASLELAEFQIESTNTFKQLKNTVDSNQKHERKAKRIIQERSKIQMQRKEAEDRELEKFHELEELREKITQKEQEEACKYERRVVDGLDYHNNYKMNDEKPLKLSVLKGDNSGKYKNYSDSKERPTSVQRPKRGTLNRRKLFDAVKIPKVQNVKVS